MSNPTPARYCEVQLQIASFLQKQLTNALEQGDFNTASVIARTLKDVTTSYRDISGNGSSPSKLSSQGLGYGSITNLDRENISEARSREPRVPTQYSYPDGFEGVTLSNGDAWDDQ